MVGRPRSGAVDAAIAAAVADLLAERGYVATTVDAVANRARVPKSTLYRRWASKAEMIFETTVHQPDLVPPADTGSLEGDLRKLAELVVGSLSRPAARNAIPGLLGDLLADPKIADRFRDSFLGAERALIQTVLDRNAARDDTVGDTAGDTAAEASPAILHAQLLGTAFAWIVLFDDPIPSDLAERLSVAALAYLRTGEV